MLGLRLIPALWAALPLLARHVMIGSGLAEPGERLAYDAAALLLMNLVGALVCYRLEHGARTIFLEREIVNILAGNDALTGIPNRRMFNAHLQRVWRQALRESRGLALAILEIDHYPEFLERYGQRAADVCLKRVAHAVMGCARRPFDFTARFSREEFALVLFDPEQSYVEELFARIRDHVVLLDIPHETSPASERVSVSVGVAMAPPGVKLGAQELLELADAALAEVKGQGRNAVVVEDASRACAGDRVFRGPWPSPGRE